MRIATRSGLTALAIGCLLGCGGGDDGPPRASVSGKLTIDGKPVEGVDVNFVHPDHPQHGSYAQTDAEGNFRLVQGAVVGVNTVFFSKVSSDMAMTDAEGGMDAGQFEAMAEGNPQNVKGGPKIEQVIPPEYATSASKLTFNVPEGGTDSANFEL
jgi:hypothetical protein